MSAAHSKLGASSMHRWSACPGSVRLCADIPNTSSVYAEEGTEAHRILAECLDKGCEAFEHPDANGENAEPIQVALGYIRSLRRPGKDHLLIEHRFDLSSVFRGCFGTADVVIWRPDEQLLVVIDYKHGAGIAVAVEGNPQLDYYALGALLTCGFPAKRVRKVIVQPRCAHAGGEIREHEIDAIDLLDFQGDLVQYAKATEAPDAKLVPGDQCRFCPAAATCPALRSRAQGVAKTEFSTDLSYDPATLAEALAARPLVQAWLKAVDEFAYREAEAGRTPPGWKLVDKRATRKWKSEGEAMLVADTVKEKHALDLYAPREVLSPAQSEKVLGKKLFAEICAPLVESVSSGRTLVPESDKRPAAKAGAALDFFD